MYTPRQLQAGADVALFLAQELQNIAQSVNTPQALRLPMLYAQPKNPRDGDLVLADGTTWNPGSGAGFYGYRAGAWRFLG